MSAGATAKIELGVPNPDWAESDVLRDSIQFGVRNYASGLLSDLGLEIDAAVSVDILDDDLAEMTLAINGQDARLDFTRQVGAQTPTDRICREIYRNRELLAASSSKRRSAKPPEGLRTMQERALKNVSVQSSFRNYVPSTKVSLNRRWWNDWSDSQKKHLASATLREVQTRVFELTGIPCRAPEIDFDQRLAPREYRIVVNDVRSPKIQCSDDDIDRIPHAVEEAMLDDRVALFTRQVFNRMIAPIERQWPRLFLEVTSTPGLDTAYDVVCRLIQEGVRIVNMDRIFDTFTRAPRPHLADDRTYITFGPAAELSINADPDKPMSVGDWTRLVRSNLKREFASQYAHANSMSIYLLDPDLEGEVHGKNPADVRSDVFGAIAGAVGSEPQLIITSETVRRPIWRIIERRLPQVTVLSFQELGPDLSLEVISRISLPP